MKPQIILATALLTFALPAPAQISTDGTLGPSVNLSGPNFQIGANLGQQYGGNLFHSFRDFNLSSHESATFSGPNSVQNILSRVTGGNPSNIDGLFRSTIPGADVYFLNPYGIMFGPNARLDVQGSFHASTADYLRLGENGRFDVRNPSDSILTVAPVESFGFLTNSPAKITTQSSKLLVPRDKTLSLIGGDLHLTSDTPLTADNSRPIPTVESESILAAEHGQVNLASITSPGEVILDENNLTLQGTGGQITLENTLIEMSGHSGGAVFIRAGQLVLDNAIIRSNTYGNQDGKSINIKLTEAAYLNGLNSEISVLTASQNNAGRISIKVPYLEISGAFMNTGSVQTGQAGNIKIHAKDVILKDGAFIASGSLYAGKSGNIILDVEDSLSIMGFTPGYRIRHGIEYVNAKTMIFSISIGAGNSGNIAINTNNLNMNIGSISTDSFEMGKAGSITINAQQASLMGGSTISNNVHGQGEAGYIKMNIAEKLYIAGKLPFTYITMGTVWEDLNSAVSSASFGSAFGGIIDIQANDIIIDNNGEISASSLVTGNAGDIVLQANKLRVMNNGMIRTSADYSIGGNISLTVPNLLYLQNGTITTSVHGGDGDGGNITIESPDFAVLNQGQIKAQADAGHGGNIRIVAEQFIASPDSLVSASSRLGLDGEVQIESPAVDMDGFLVVLPGTPLPSEIPDRCRGITDPDQLSTFSVNIEGEGMPTTPSSLME